MESDRSLRLSKLDQINTRLNSTLLKKQNLRGNSLTGNSQGSKTIFTRKRLRGWAREIIHHLLKKRCMGIEILVGFLSTDADERTVQDTIQEGITLKITLTLLKSQSSIKTYR